MIRVAMTYRLCTPPKFEVSHRDLDHAVQLAQGTVRGYHAGVLHRHVEDDVDREARGQVNGWDGAQE
jgi:hypothetical protein